MKTNKLILIIILFCLLFLSGCSAETGVESKAYVIAMGLDKGETEKLKLSLQIAILNGQDQTSGSSSGSDASTVISIDCSSIDSGISLINSHISKKINLSHCKAIIFSEELAYEGTSDVLYTLVTNIEVRPDCNIIVSRCNASDFLEESTPIFESNPAHYYELILNSTEYSGYVSDIYLYNFYSSILNSTSKTVAILGGINTEKTQSLAKENGITANSLDGNYMPDQTPIKSKNSFEIIGCAVFSGDKLVGELDNIETLCHLIVTNKLENAIVTIPNPFNLSNNISVYISLNKDTKNKVSFINDFPFIECNVSVTGDVLSMEPSVDLTNSEYVDMLNSYVSKYLEGIIDEYLYKTSKEFKSDIASLGSFALSQYLTWDDWIKSDWLNNYQNSFFKVSVETNIQGGYLFTDI